MGIGASTAAGLENPFPIEPAMEKDLIRLSYVVSRLLNKPDLYDLNNLARPGACGDYAIFLKDKLEKRLLPFVADICGETLSVVYQNPLKAFTSIERRKQVCQDLANTMIRLVSIVVASLASLQFESPRVREAAGVSASVQTSTVPATTSPYIQRGGGSDTDVLRWLQQYGYVSRTYVPSLTESRYEIPLQDPEQSAYAAIPSGSFPVFTLQLNRELEADQQVYKGYITVRGGSPPFPEGGFLRIFIRRPAQISSTTSILPLHVIDNTGVTWMCGALYKQYFLTLASSNRKLAFMFDILAGIFRKTQPEILMPEDPVESRRALQEAEAIFMAARTERSDRIILSALAPMLSSQEGYGVGIPRYGAPTPGYAYTGGVGAVPPGLMVPRRPMGLGYGYGAAGRPGELTAGEYVIPPPAAKTILTTFRKHAGEIGAANNPAQIRATLLAGEVLRDRTIQTRICQDPYWNAASLATIYPWAALQFLCIEDFRKLGGETTATVTPIQPVIPVAAAPAVAAPAAAAARPLGPTRPKLSSEWKTFYDGLMDIYRGEGVPTLSTTTRAIRGPAAPAALATPTSISLEDIRFFDIAKTKGCSTPGKSPRARFQEIQNGVLRLQGLYEEHAAEVWKLLNSMIFLIEDPDTKSELVRLNPKIFSSGESTHSFIEEKATEARKLLIEYYLAVERTYVETIRRMRVLA